MKKTYLFLVSLLVSTLSFGQEITENFDYGATPEDLINVGFNWLNITGGDALPFIGYLGTSLTMPDYEPLAIGGSAKLNISSQPGQFGQDLHLEVLLPGLTNYFSALVNVTFARTGGSDYFMHFNSGEFLGLDENNEPIYNNENDRARVFVRDDGNGGINFGILSKGESTNVSWDTNSYAKATTYLIVAAYQIESGISNLYVLTAPVANEPAQPSATHQSQDLVGVSAFSLRQKAFSPSATIDAIKVAGSWAELWPPLNFADSNLATAMTDYTLAIDLNGDGEINLEEAAAYTGDLDFSSLGINDVSGLQYFANINELDLSGNNISDLRVLFGNTSTSKRSLGKNSSAKSFEGLQVLNCSNNNLTSLDLSVITTLTSLDCSNNLLESLNLKSGSNSILASFDATSNSSLTCIQVDDEVWSTANWTNIDGQTNFNTDCSLGLGLDDTVVKDVISFYPNPVSKIINLKTNQIIQNATLYNLLGQEVAVFNKESIINNSIDVSNYLKGIYFLQVELGSKVQVVKFVKI